MPTPQEPQESIHEKFRMLDRVRIRSQRRRPYRGVRQEGTADEHCLNAGLRLDY